MRHFFFKKSVRLKQLNSRCRDIVHVSKLEQLYTDLEPLGKTNTYGTVRGLTGLLVYISGLNGLLAVGDRCALASRQGADVLCEVVGFRDDTALCMAYGDLSGIALGTKAKYLGSSNFIYPSDDWIGRVVNAFGEPIDGLPLLKKGIRACPLKASPPNAHARQRVKDKVDLGIRSINTFLTCCKGQRLGIFSGSGVGKSTLLSMVTRYTENDITIIGLIGERGRELREFLEDDLGPEGMKRAIVVVATSDEAPLMRRQAAYMTMALAEHFRDSGMNVLCILDSITRFAMSQREIGLAAGEPPATKGYTPSVFSELPRLLERAGPGINSGSITGLFSVLVEGDDTNEPISDAVRGIIDGHIVLSRKIAERGRFPAVDILRSVSRSMPDCNTPEENELVTRAKEFMADYDRMEELIRIGAYRKGSDSKVDHAIYYHDALEQFLSQKIEERVDFQQSYDHLLQILRQPPK